ncbi:MAG: hypothetical protein WCP69_08655 [Bacteroidota bacterium]
MRIKNLLFLFVLQFVFAITSCTNIDESPIYGEYEIDKRVVRDTSIVVDVYEILSIKRDKTFELKHYSGKEGNLLGSWKIQEISSKKSIGSENYEINAKIQFTLQSKTILGEIRDNIIYFEFPNDFYSGRFDKLLYVKRND